MVIGISQDAYRVDQANWKLFTGMSSLLPTLNGDGLPSVPFRCAVTLSSVTGHADCAGSITIGSETLTFTAAGKKTTTTSLTALPVITPTGMDCNILVEALNSGGAPILKKTTTAIKCRFMNSQKAFVDAAGAWTLSQAIADTTDSNCSIGDMFRFDGVDYIIGQISCFVGPTGTEIFRRLFLK